jgi:hypothetical protein
VLLKTQFFRIMIRCQEYARIQDFKQFTPDPLPISASHFSCPSIPQYLFIYFFDSSKSSLLYYLNFLNFCVHDIVKKIYEFTWSIEFVRFYVKFS